MPLQDPNYVVAIKSISKKSLAKSQNLLGKEIKILKVFIYLGLNYVYLFLVVEISSNAFISCSRNLQNYIMKMLLLYWIAKSHQHMYSWLWR